MFCKEAGVASGLRIYWNVERQDSDRYGRISYVGYIGVGKMFHHVAIIASRSLQWSQQSGS